MDTRDKQPTTRAPAMVIRLMAALNAFGPNQHAVSLGDQVVGKLSEHVALLVGDSKLHLQKLVREAFGAVAEDELEEDEKVCVVFVSFVNLDVVSKVERYTALPVEIFVQGKLVRVKKEVPKHVGWKAVKEFAKEELRAAKVLLANA